MNFMQIVYKVIDYYHFTDARPMCYGKATLRKNNLVSSLCVNSLVQIVFMVNSFVL